MIIPPIIVSYSLMATLQLVTTVLLTMMTLKMMAQFMIQMMRLTPNQMLQIFTPFLAKMFKLDNHYNLM